MSAYERFRKDIDDGQYDDQDPYKKTTADLQRETEAALEGGAMSHEESRLLLLRYIDWLVRQLRRRSSPEPIVVGSGEKRARHTIR
jgi:hypothetical protein